MATAEPNDFKYWVGFEKEEDDEKAYKSHFNSYASKLETKDETVCTNGTSILDSGDRTMFESGAVRDMKDGKGRCDLMPLGVISNILDDHIIGLFNGFLYDPDPRILYDIYNVGVHKFYPSNKPINISRDVTAILDVSIHYEEGAKKYGERNWEQGIPLHSFIDSAIRHYLKALRGDTDEPHVRAFLWNVLGAIWTMENKKEYVDI